MTLSDHNILNKLKKKSPSPQQDSERIKNRKEKKRGGNLFFTKNITEQMQKKW